ncbi:MAG: hypothetical protein PHH93_06335 [Prolixibacteraceae bacterium]|nr:hypothetical protein [Prolixibacteraceae bacterium]
MKQKMIFNLFLITFAAATALPALFCQEINAGPLRAGVAKVNIIKENPAELINDSLYVKALVISDGKTEVVFITMDIINVEYPVLMEIRGRIRDELKINPNNVNVSVSHNHWVKNQLAEDYIDRTIKAVKLASENMVPVKTGTGSGIEKKITMNRRLLLKNGKEWTIRRATPEPPDDQIAKIAEGFDPEIGILRLDKTDGKPLAVLYNFAIHSYTGVANRGVTASTPGISSAVIEDILGDGAVALFTNGAAGDITPVLYKDVNMPKMDEMFGTYLGVSTLKAWRNIPLKKDADIKIITEKFALPPRSASEVQMHIDSLEAQKTRIIDYFKGKGCGSLGGGTKLNFKSFLPLYVKYLASPEYPSDYPYRYMQEELTGLNDLEVLDEENRNDIEKYLSSIKKMEELIVTEANLGYLKGNKTSDPIEIEITGIRIGDFVMITFPGELFSAIGLALKQSSPHRYTFISAYTNGRIGYSPVREAYSGDAYEASLSVLAPEWQKIFEDKAEKILNRLQ